METHYHGKVVRFNCDNFNASEVTVLDLTEYDPDLRGFGGGFQAGKFGYLVPYKNREVGGGGERTSPPLAVGRFNEVLGTLVFTNGADKEVVQELYASALRESYAAAPPEFVEEQRRADPFNAALPRLTLAEIAAEFLAIAETGVGKARGAAPAPDFGSLNPNRKRGPREQGNKIEIKKPAGGGGGDDA